MAAKEAQLISHIGAKSRSGDIGESISSDSARLPLECLRQTSAVMQREKRRHQSLPSPLSLHGFAGPSPLNGD